MSVPKLNFRAKPLKLPVFIKPPEKVEKVEEPPPKKPYILYFPVVFLLVFLLRWFIYTNTALHKIKELPCKLDRRTVRCMSHEHKGTLSSYRTRAHRCTISVGFPSPLPGTTVCTACLRVNWKSRM